MAGHTEPDDKYAQVMEEKRKAILWHLNGICEFPANVYYKKCGHQEKKEWFLESKLCFW